MEFKIKEVNSQFIYNSIKCFLILNIFVVARETRVSMCIRLDRISIDMKRTLTMHVHVLYMYSACFPLRIKSTKRQSYRIIST